MFHIKRRSWGKEPSGINVTPPPPLPPQRYCDCLLRYEDYTNIWGERACKQCRKPRPPIEVFMTPATQQAKERMNMSNYPAAIDSEIARLTALLSTPNLSQANIDEINAQIGALLRQKSPVEKKNEVILDDK